MESCRNFWERPGWMQPTQAMKDIIMKDNMKHTEEVPADLAKLSASDQLIYHSLATEEQKKVYLERQKVYGSCTHSHQCIGQAWAAYINNLNGTNLPPLSATAVAHMLTIFKVLRAAKVYHPDNYVDGHNYFEFSNCFQKAGA